MSSIELSFHIKPPPTSVQKEATSTHEIRLEKTRKRRWSRSSQRLRRRDNSQTRFLTGWKEEIGELEKAKERATDEEIKRDRAQNQDEEDSDDDQGGD
jgi:hypothetical protein